jgi:hypothetical protein
VKKNLDIDRIGELKQEISELKARWPAHSVPPSMLQQLEDLEEELKQLMALVKKEPTE